MEADLWNRKALDLIVPAYISFDRQDLGEMQLIAIGASIDYRVERCDDATVLEFSWSGFDEAEEVFPGGTYMYEAGNLL